MSDASQHNRAVVGGQRADLRGDRRSELVGELQDGIYKVVCRAEDYPSTQPRFYKLSSGDSFVLMDRENIVKPGDEYKNYPAFVTRVIYEPRKWWQFWKRKRQLGYVIQWK